MDVTVVLDHKFYIDGSGRYCAHTMFGDSFWSRYLEVFDHVNVICRAKQASSADEALSPILDPRVRFRPVPYYEGPSQFVRKYSQIARAVDAYLPARGAVVLRVPQILPNLAFELIRKRGSAFAAEVVGDPWDVYAPGAESHPLRPIFRLLFYKRLKRICRLASSSCYVTEHALQSRYPPRYGSFSTHASSVEITDVVQQSRSPDCFKAPLRLLFVGTMNRLYKGQDVLLNALTRCSHDVGDFELVMVGDGQLRGDLERMARTSGIGHRVTFVGAVPFGAPVLSIMDDADLFVLPSRQEGLPRVVIEAMSRGLPCIASDVGGIGEILDPACLVRPGDVDSLAGKLAQVMGDREFLASQSRDNLRTARKFLPAEIEPRRRQFYEDVRRIAERQNAA